ncbi:MAG: hypothetical protein PHE67_00485 [Campylobacterales bacterium]|nr:hypothetical protein [Campylobacterales bacterium]
MKKIVLSLASLCAIVSYASAAEVVGKLSSVKYDYMETSDSGQNLDSERTGFGKINGFDISIRSNDYVSTKSRFFNSVDFSYHGGNTQYIGSYQGGKYGDLTTTSKNKIYELEYKFGGAMSVTNNVTLGANIGAGLRNWQRSLADGNVETYYWSNWILGLRSDYSPTDRLMVSATADWQKAVNPKMYSTGAGATFDLGDTGGYKLGLHTNYKLNNRLSVEGDYEYDFWKIGKSNMVNIGGSTVAWEPDSKTKNHVIKLGLAYKI